MLILEIANCHAGSKSYLEELIDKFSSLSQCAIKFQIISADGLALPDYKWYEVYQKLEFTEEDWGFFLQKASSLFADVWLDIFDSYGVKIAINNKVHVSGIKLQASVLQNASLLEQLKPLIGLKLILNVSGASHIEIEGYIQKFAEVGFADITLQVGIQSYPTKPLDSGLSKIEQLKSFNLPICYADHSDPKDPLKNSLILTSFLLGCTSSEVHICNQRSTTIYDQQSAFELDEVVILNNMLNNIKLALDSPFITEAETAYLESTLQVPVSLVSFEPRSRLKLNYFTFKRANNSSSFVTSSTLLSSIAKDYRITSSISTNTPISQSNLRKPKIGIIIACRLKSSRLPRKAFELIGPFTSLELCVLNCRKSNIADHVIVATSTDSQDDALCAFMDESSINYMRGDPINVLDRYNKIANELDLDIIVRVTADCPFVSADLTDNMLIHYLSNRYDYMRHATAPVGLAPEIFEASALSQICKLSSNPQHSEYMTWYFTNNTDHFYCHLYADDIKESKHRLTLDYPSDLKMMNNLFEQFKFDPFTTYKISDILEFLDNHPEISSINSSNTLQYKVDSVLINTLNKETRLS